MVSLHHLRKQARMQAVWGRLVLWLLGTRFSGDSSVECLSAQPQVAGRIEGREAFMGELLSCLLLWLLKENRMGS